MKMRFQFLKYLAVLVLAGRASAQFCDPSIIPPFTTDTRLGLQIPICNACEWCDPLNNTLNQIASRACFSGTACGVRATCDTLANLVASGLSDGDIRCCSDCNQVTPCTSGGTGAALLVINGVNSCSGGAAATTTTTSTSTSSSSSSSSSTSSSSSSSTSTTSTTSTSIVRLTTKGDLIGHDGSTTVRVPVGNQNGLVLTVNNAATPGIDWEAATGVTNANYLMVPAFAGSMIQSAVSVVSVDSTGANGTNCQSFIPPYTITGTKLAFRVTTQQATALCGVAIYTISGSTWTKSAAVAEGQTCSTAGLKSNTFASTTLTAGTVYGFCSTSTITTVQAPGFAQGGIGTNVIANAFVTRFGTGQNSASGVNPTTVSPISDANISQWIAIFSAE